MRTILRNIFYGLSVLCILFFVICYIAEFFDGSHDENSALLLIAGIFLGFVFWLIAIIFAPNSSVDRVARAAKGAAVGAKEERNYFKGLGPELKRRYIKYAILGYTFIILGLFIIGLGLYYGFQDIDGGMEFFAILGTFVLIGGLYFKAKKSPGSYNETNDVTRMVLFENDITIEDIYEAFKNLWTPFGSCYLVKYTTMQEPALVWGPALNDQYLSFSMANENTGYLTATFTDIFVEKKLCDPLIPAPELSDEMDDNICYSANIMIFMEELYGIIENYAKTGVVLQAKQLEKSETYYFDEAFKWTGQHFKLSDTNGNAVYDIDATYPLINFSLRDTSGNELLKITKELIHALPTYRFEYLGEPYGVLEKEFTFYRDEFTMETGAGTLKLREYAATIGHNFHVTLNGREVGVIMDNMNLELRNFVFDNSVIVCYDRQYLPLITGFAVMVARELARDRGSGLDLSDED